MPQCRGVGSIPGQGTRILHAALCSQKERKKKDRMLVICVKNGLCYFSERTYLPHFGAWNTLCKNICIKDVSKDLVVYGELR